MSLPLLNLMILSASFFAALSILYMIKCFDYLPECQLRNLAKSGDLDANKVLKLRADVLLVRLILWAAFGLSITITLFMLEANLWLLLALSFGTITSVFMHGLFPLLRYPRPRLSVLAKIQPQISIIIAVVKPFWRKLEPIVGQYFERDQVLVIHGRDHLLEILANSSNLSDKVSLDEVKIAENALVFGDKTVSQIMTPWKVVVSVELDADIDDKLITELVKSGFSRVPVVRTAGSREVAGILYVKDLIKHPHLSQVAKAMRTPVYYINDLQTIDVALNAFLKNHCHLFVVVNEFEDIIGVISLEDVVEQILGKPIVDEFDQYEDLRAVARLKTIKSSSMISSS